MPRMPGAPVVTGGKMDPGTMESVVRNKQFRQQRAMLETQEAGAKERAELASETDIRTTGMREAGAGQRAALGAQAAYQTAQMGERGAKERTAMQIAAGDRRAAETIRSQRETEKFLENQQKRLAVINAKAAAVDHAWNLEAEDRSVGRAKDAQKLELELRRDELQYEMSQSADNTEIMMGIFNHTIENEEGRAKEGVAREQIAERHQQLQGSLDILREDMAASIVANPGLSYRTWSNMGDPGIRPEPDIGKFIGEEYDRLGIEGVTVQVLSDYTQLEDLVEKDKEEGGIGLGELMELKILTEALEEHFEETLKTLSEGENALFYQEKLRRVKKIDRTLHRLKRSNKKEVRDVASEAWRAVEGVSPSAIISKYQGSDTASLLAGLKAARTDRGPTPKFTGPFADLFFEALSRRRKRFDSLVSK